MVFLFCNHPCLSFLCVARSAVRKRASQLFAAGVTVGLSVPPEGGTLNKTRPQTRLLHCLLSPNLYLFNWSLPTDAVRNLRWEAGIQQADDTTPAFNKMEAIASITSNIAQMFRLQVRIY